MWLFAYGSLLWTADFPIVQEIPGCITGYARRFWLADEERTGIPGKPGRVATLVPTRNPKDIVWGVTFQIADQDVENVVAQLDFHEKEGYMKETTTFYPVPLDRIKNTHTIVPFEVELFVPTEDNKFFKKGEAVEETASCIASAHGLGGSNAQYLFTLTTAMRYIAPKYDDSYLFTLETAVKKIHSGEEASAEASGQS